VTRRRCQRVHSGLLAGPPGGRFGYAAGGGGGGLSGLVPPAHLEGEVSWGGVFVNYRGCEHGAAVEALYHRLADHFGESAELSKRLRRDGR